MSVNTPKFFSPFGNSTPERRNKMKNTKAFDVIKSDRIVNYVAERDIAHATEYNNLF